MCTAPALASTAAQPHAQPNVVTGPTASPCNSIIDPRMVPGTKAGPAEKLSQLQQV